MKNRIIALCILFLFAAGNLFADTIILKSGKEVECKILEKTSDSVKVDFQGVTLTYFLSDIDKINNEQLTSVVQETAPVVDATPAQPPAVENTPALSVVVTEPVKEESPKNITSSNLALNDRAQMEAKLEQAKQKVYTGALIFSIVVFIISIIIYIYSSICLYIIAKKAGKDPAWLAWIPIGSFFLMCKIGSVSYWWLLGLIVGVIPYIGILVYLALIIYILYKMAIALNKPGWVAFLILIPIVGPFIAWGYLAFTKD